MKFLIGHKAFVSLCTTLTYRRKIQIQMNCISKYRNYSGQSPFTSVPVLTFYEIYYPTHLPTSHSARSNKRGI